MKNQTNNNQVTVNSCHSHNDSKAHFSDENMEVQVTIYVSPHQGLERCSKVQICRVCPEHRLLMAYGVVSDGFLGEVILQWRMEEGTAGIDQAATQNEVVHED